MTAVNSLPAEWSQRFRNVLLAKKVVLDLEGRSQEIWHKTFELLRQESPEYRNAVDDEFTEESRNHCGELLETIIAIAAERLNSSDPFGFVRRHAEWRARHQVPLVASLHAYRLAHKTYWGITRGALAKHTKRAEALRALGTLSDFWIELFEVVGSVLEEAHAVEEARIVAQNTLAYSALIDDLLRGIKPVDREACQLWVLCGFRSGAPMAVAVIRPLLVDHVKHIDGEVTLRSLVRLIHQVVPPTTFGKLVELRNGEVVMIVSDETGPSRRLLKVLTKHGFGRRGARNVAVGGGVSLDKMEVAQLPEALAEARMALDLTAASRPLIHFSDIDLPEFLIRHANTAALRLIPAWAHEAHRANGQTGELFRTVRTFAECSLNVKETAQKLSVHTNTVYFRLNQIKKRTGVDPRTFSGATFLLTALNLLEVHPGSVNGPRS